MLRRKLISAAAALIAAFASASPAAAEAPEQFPSKSITLIVPWQPGSTADLLFRGMADVAARRLGQAVVVDNRAGAGGTLGPATMAANARPDGYTIAQIPAGVFRLPAMQKVAYDPIKDFTFVIHLAGYNFGVVARTDGPFKQWRDVVEYARANPSKVTYSSGGVGTTAHIGMEMIAAHDGIQLTHVPMKGGSESVTALLGGHVMLQAESPSWRQMVEAGKFRVLHVWSEGRNAKWPDAPSLRELGYPLVFESPFGIGGPKGMDPAVVRKLHDAFKAAYEDPKVVELYDRFEFSRRYMSSADYAALVPRLVAEEREGLEKAGLARKN